MEPIISFEEFLDAYLSIYGTDRAFARQDYESMCRKHDPDTSGIVFSAAVVATTLAIRKKALRGEL